MRVWVTVIGQRLDGAENTRSMLLCSKLIELGHNVTMWTSAYDHIRKIWRPEWAEGNGKPVVRDDGLEIRFMKGCGYRENVSIGRFVDHWLASRDFVRQAGNIPKPDVIVASIPDHLTASAAVAWGLRHGVVTVVDVRDKWPDIFLDYVKSPLLAGIVSTGLAGERRRVARTLKEADAVVAMMNSMLDWALKKARRRKTWRERVFYLTTTPKNFGVELPKLTSDSVVPNIIAKLSGKVVFTFVGTFNRTQHPNLILDAVERLHTAGLSQNRMAFVIGGSGADFEQVRDRAEKYDNVFTTGWLNTDEMAVLLAHSSAGILAMNFSSPAFNNKAFAYMASGLPIINGATGDLAELIEINKVGINVPGGDSQALADALLSLASDPELLSAMRGNVQNLFDANFDRDKNYSQFVQHLEMIVAEVRSVGKSG